MLGSAWSGHWLPDRCRIAPWTSNHSGRLITLPTAEFETLLERAAETGARRALHEVGLDGQDAAEDIRDLRSLPAGLRLAKQTAVQTSVRLITIGILLALMAGIAIKLKLFGSSA